MQKLIETLKEHGIEVPQEKQDEVKTALSKYYKNINEYEKLTAKLTKLETERDGLKKSLDDVQGKLDSFKDVNVDDLKSQITTLTQQLADEKAARASDAAKAEREKTVNAFLASVDDKGERLYPFLNDITEEYYRKALMEELDKDSAKGKSIGDIFSAMITGEDGKQKEGIFVNKAEASRARFTTPSKPGNPAPGSKYTMAELMKMKNENPNMDISQYM